MIDLDSPEQFMQRRMRSVDRRRLLQPRTTGQITDFAARTYQRIAWPVLKMTLPSSALLFVVLVFCQAFVVPGIFQTRTSGEIAQQFEEVMVILGAFVFLAVPVAMLAMSHAIGVTTRAVADYVLEQRTDFDKAMEGARSGLRTMFGLLAHVFWRCGVYVAFSGALYMVGAYFEDAGMFDYAEIATVIATLALIVSFLLVPLFFGSVSLAPAVTAIENVDARTALKRGKLLVAKSRHIPSGYDALVHVWVIAVFFGGLLWLGLLGLVSALGPMDTLRDLTGQTFFGSLIYDTIVTIPSLVAIWLIVPYLACGLTIVYFDRRIKLEALDIEAMARDAIKGTQQADLRS